MTSVFHMTKAELKAIPPHDWSEPVICNSLIIIPSNRMHDSGYRCIEVIACDSNVPICKVTASSDDLNLDSGRPFVYRGREHQKPVAWRIDCLPKSGLFRIWLSSGSGKIIIRTSTSSLDIESMDD